MELINVIKIKYDRHRVWE